MKKISLSVGIAMLTSVGIAQNFTAVYAFDSVKATTGLIDPTPVPISTGVAFGGFIAAGTSANSNAATRFSFTKWPTGATTGDDTYSSLTGSVNTSEYYEVTIGPENGYTLDLTDITFSVQRSGTGIRTYVVRSSMDGYAANLTASIAPANAKLSIETGAVFFWNSDATITNQNGSTLTLGGVNFTGLTSPVTFRFYGYNSESTSGTFSIDDVTFTGTVNAITTSIVNTASAEIAMIYPNPSATGVFTVDLGSASSRITITAFNIIGKLLFTKEINEPAENNIDLSDEANGTYFIIIKNDRAILTQKIIINK